MVMVVACDNSWLSIFFIMDPPHLLSFFGYSPRRLSCLVGDAYVTLFRGAVLYGCVLDGYTNSILTAH